MQSLQCSLQMRFILGGAYGDLAWLIQHWNLIFSSPLAGGYLPIDKQEGPEAQYSYYKQTYDTAQASLQGNTGLKGIMFWRWAGVDPTAKLADFDEAATIGECCPRSST
jgi:hypothetical protein